MYASMIIRRPEFVLGFVRFDFGPGGGLRVFAKLWKRVCQL